ncbi:hypothetical protein [Terriglobus sp.]|uniref:hypothetical protein n=1 Tax=Terriglobus sp. TaxID=1889013 RepID=UPI003B009094
MFQITSVDAKEDRLEFKLTPRTQGSGRLKLMLGTGWQSRMNDASVLNALSQFVETNLPVKAASSKTTESPESGTVPLSPKASVAMLQSYDRPPETTDIPGRLPVADVKQTLDLLDKKILREQADVNRATQGISQAVKACKSVYASVPDSVARNVVQEIAGEQAQLGVQLTPRTMADVTMLTNIYNRCARLARLRQAGDPSGQQYGPGSGNAEYNQSFLSGGSTRASQEGYDSAKDGLQYIDSLVGNIHTVLEIERSLDAGKLTDATRGYAVLAADKEPADAIRAYLQKSEPLRTDLISLERVKQTVAAAPSGTIQEKLTTVRQLQSMETNSAHLPMTRSFLKEIIGFQKAKISAAVQRIAPFDRSCLPAKASASRMTEEQAQARSSRLQACLGQSGDRVALKREDLAMRTLGDLLDAEVFASLQTKQVGIAEALADSAQVSARLTTVNAERAKADEARRQVEQQRKDAASEIVRTALMVVALDEQFDRTQIVGYLSKSKEEQAQLTTLIRRYRSPALWAQIHEEYKRVEQGLTITRASRLSSLLAAARP